MVKYLTFFGDKCYTEYVVNILRLFFATDGHKQGNLWGAKNIICRPSGQFGFFKLPFYIFALSCRLAFDGKNKFCNI